MQLKDILTEYEERGVVSKEAIEVLRSHLRGSDPYDAITVAADCGVFDVSEELVECLKSHNPMVRWNATAALFTRLRNPYYAHRCQEIANSETDEMVRSVALCGLGEILNSVSDRSLQRQMSLTLIRVFEDDSELLELRGAAYEGVLAALDIPAAKRPPADRLISLPSDVDAGIVRRFRDKFL